MRRLLPLHPRSTWLTDGVSPQNGALNSGLGMTDAPVSVEEGVKGVVNQSAFLLRSLPLCSGPNRRPSAAVDKATLEATSGQFVDFDRDDRIPW